MDTEGLDQFGIPLELEEDFKTAAKKFVDQGKSKAEVDQVISDFKLVKAKIQKASERDIDQWAKGDFESFKNFVQATKEVKTKTQKKKIEKSEGAELVAENEDWYVYRITSHKACMSYGSGTKWCITTPDGEHWNEYSKNNNFYFIISKTERDDEWNKIALQVGVFDEVTYWDEIDEEHSELPDGLNIPKFEIEKPDIKIDVDGTVMTLKEFESSKNLSVGGALDLSHTEITSLPAGLKVGGGLYLSYTQITSLPAGLSVGGALDLSHTPITSLPAGLKVGGGLYLSHTKITSLPAGLKVGGGLYLSHTKITSLPADLSVGGNLDLDGTLITSLPAGLKVGGNLDLDGTLITSLPADLSVGGNLYLGSTPLAKKWNDSMKPKGVKEVFL